jgi:hypothetical protein
MFVNMVPNFTSVVAAFCQMYGKGGREIFIPAHVIRDLSPTGTVEQLPDDPTNPGIRIRYNPNRPPIEGQLLNVTPVEPETAPVVFDKPDPEPQLPPQPHVDEWA